VKRQLQEIKGKESKVDQKALKGYLSQTSQSVRAIESSLDMGLVGIPQE